VETDNSPSKNKSSDFVRSTHRRTALFSCVIACGTFVAAIIVLEIFFEPKKPLGIAGRPLEYYLIFSNSFNPSSTAIFRPRIADWFIVG